MASAEMHTCHVLMAAFGNMIGKLYYTEMSFRCYNFFRFCFSIWLWSWSNEFAERQSKEDIRQF